MSDENNAPEEQIVTAADNNAAESQVQENNDIGEAGEALEEIKEIAPEVSDKKERKKGWAQIRIDELATEKNAAREEAENSKKQVASLLAELASARSGAGEGEDKARLPHSEIERLAIIKAEEIANRKIAQTRSDDIADRVWNDGLKEFPDFANTISNLNNSFGEKFGNMAPIIMEALDNPHKVMHHLGDNLDEAARILSLSPAKQVAELTKLESSLATKQKQISKVAAPIKTIDGKGKVDPTLDSEEISTAEWMKIRIKDLEKKGKRLY